VRPCKGQPSAAEARLGLEGEGLFREGVVDAVVARARIEHVGRRLGAGDRRSSGVEAEVVGLV